VRPVRWAEKAGLDCFIIKFI